MKNLTIKTKLIILIISVSTILIVIGWFSNNSINKIGNLNTLESQFKEVKINTLELRKNEKDFLLREVTNKEFFATGESKYLTNIENTIEKIRNDLQNLQKNELIKKYELENNILRLEDLFLSYSEKLFILSDEIRTKGFEDYGLIGEMRNAVHEVENSLKYSSAGSSHLISILTLRKHEKDYLIRMDPTYKEKFNTEIQKFITGVESDNNLNAEMKNLLLKDIKLYQQTFLKVIDEDVIVGMTESEGLQGEFRDVVHKVDPLITEINTSLDENIGKTKKLVIVQLIVFIIAGILLLVLFSLIIIFSINKSLNYANEKIKNISEGDLMVNIEIDGKDEIAHMLGNFKIMVEKLKDIVVNIISGAENIASASQQMSSTSQQMSQGANEQASSAEEVSSSMEEMVSNIQQNTDNAQSTEKIAVSATEGINQGNESTKISVDSMKQIAEKITIVNDIAFQTNILALNAAVEAARAGEHGKGFAVVAAEVRKLAERSKVAADEIDQLSKNGVAISEQAGQQLGAIVPEIEKTAKLVQEIAAASIEQNSGADQVNNAIQQLNQVTQQNAAASEEMATSSEELSSQADQLKELISYFKVDNKRTVKRVERKTQSNIGQKEGKTPVAKLEKTPKKGADIKLEAYDSKDDEYENF